MSFIKVSCAFFLKVKNNNFVYMGRKKNIKDVDELDLEFINSKMGYSSNDRNGDTAIVKSYEYKVSIKCKNKKQKEFLNTLKEEKNKICFGIGSAGSGKSYISLSYALQALACVSSPYKKIICLVPTCEAGNLNIGFLKGTLEEKIEPYLEADTYTMEKILSNSGNYSGKQLIEGLIRQNVIDYQLVNFARGKTFDDALILINEAENYSKEEMLLILTRIGENSRIIITGDLEQLDRKDIKKSNNMCGLEYAMEKLKDMEEVSIVEFGNEDIVRNPIITKIIENWKK